MAESSSSVASATPEAVAVAPALRKGLLAKIGFPLAVAAAYGIHAAVSKQEPELETRNYTIFLAGLGGLGLLAGALQLFLGGFRRWMQEMWPILSAAVLVFGVLEIVTTGVRLLPLPYFPSPPKILQSAIQDRVLIWESTYHSLFLLMRGYLLGVVMGVVTGVCIGWFKTARYWGMPVMKVVGPIPATAWIPLALIISPSATLSAIGLIAIAVWFPVTMLTASGIANTRSSYLDVAKTLGAKPSYLIFRVAIPAAMPNIFLGLFMGLGAAFLTLVVAETVGVKSGLGWYLGWSREWAEYGKVFAALGIMAIFFSTIMTGLFALRDRVLVWQKGTIKW
ncbi:ABC transporter permease subunit [Haloferula sp. BvORR071]|uniref:ABC transporter permease n=1 Tax=Haloferula sp. BvORR071 TaxID=1396141 RepID=UPI00054F8975|nr:ABC transporter permease subunit [Haloferula sp. BvORR071]